VLSIAVIALLIFLISRTVVSPIARVAKAARLVAGGDLRARAKVSGHAEARDLGTSFNTMAENLQESRDELEAQNTELEAQQSSLEKMVDELARQKQGIEALHHFGQLIASETDLRPLAEVVLAQLCEVSESEAGTLYATDGETDPSLIAVRGVDPGLLPETLSPGEGRGGRALVERRSVSAGRGEKLHVPLTHGDRTFGVLSLARATDRAFTRYEVEVIEYMAGQAAVALSNALALRRVHDQLAINRAVVESAHDAFVSTSSTGIITGWNTRAEQTFGWSAAEAIGRDVVSTLIVEERREPVRAEFRRFQESSTPSSTTSQSASASSRSRAACSRFRSTCCASRTARAASSRSTRPGPRCSAGARRSSSAVPTWTSSTPTTSRAPCARAPRSAPRPSPR
jgi:PAS domain-containing protein